MYTFVQVVGMFLIVYNILGHGHYMVHGFTAEEESFSSISSKMTISIICGGQIDLDNTIVPLTKPARLLSRAGFVSGTIMLSKIDLAKCIAVKYDISMYIQYI